MATADMVFRRERCPMSDMPAHWSRIVGDKVIKKQEAVAYADPAGLIDFIFGNGLSAKVWQGQAASTLERGFRNNSRYAFRQRCWLLS